MGGCSPAASTLVTRMSRTIYRKNVRSRVLLVYALELLYAVACLVRQNIFSGKKESIKHDVLN